MTKRIGSDTFRAIINHIDWPLLAAGISIYSSPSRLGDIVSLYFIYSTARGRNAFFGCRQGLFVTIKELHMIICLLYMYMCQSFMGKT